ncbi:tyrosine-type recombinase/integrase [Nocardioides sp. NPDC000445]|uniref:tyrosine-type recombinase/integrase n=1 Tax=Nocardioides sp. NPDC000445 TaxID=3154257 RepID=UPI00332B3DFD
MARRGSASEPGLSVAELRDLAESWSLALRAERKSAPTLKSYGDGVRFFLDWCEETEAEPLLRTSLQGWVAHLLEEGREASTANARHLAVRRFGEWLDTEGEIDVSPFIGLKAPKIDAKVIEPLSDDELRAMLRACQVARGTDEKETFRRRRDEAIIRVMFETTARAGETANMTLADLDLKAGIIIIRRGKGGKGRRVPFGPDAARAIDRYLRLRKHHRLADSDALWLGDRGKGFTYDALHKTLANRAADAGLEGFHPHRLRHTAAHRWLEKGGSEGGLMAVAGWTRPDMLLRYTKARAEDRAAEEARSLNLGDL